MTRRKEIMYLCLLTKLLTQNSSDISSSSLRGSDGAWTDRRTRLRTIFQWLLPIVRKNDW